MVCAMTKLRDLTPIDFAEGPGATLTLYEAPGGTLVDVRRSKCGRPDKIVHFPPEKRAGLKAGYAKLRVKLARGDKSWNDPEPGPDQAA
jgi:hypothetical protein